MQNLCNRLLFLFLFCFFPYLYGQSSKETLTVDLLTKADGFYQIKPVIDIIKDQSSVFRFIPSIHPIKAKNKPSISSPFGSRFHPIDKENKFHSGIDFVAEFATSIHATADGTVTFAGYKGGYGKCVIIKHKYGFETIYAHLTGYYTRTGAKIKKGDIIAFLGNTGKSTGAHLHYEVKKNGKAINPEDFINL